MRGALRKVVVLAAGRGTRMRSPRSDVALEPAQAEAADRGLKCLIPFAGLPFLAYVLSALAEAALTDVCIVRGAGPEADPVRRALGALTPRRLTVTNAVQAEPLGSAHALLAAESFAAGDDCAVINADNFYTPAALRLLHELPGSGLVAYRAGALTARGNITAARVAAYALLDVDDGVLTDVLEKPGSDAVRRLSDEALVSMTCWRFGPAVFDACRRVRPSARGELELPDAVRALLRDGHRLHVTVADEPVLDLSERGDIPAVAAHLRTMAVQL